MGPIPLLALFALLGCAATGARVSLSPRLDDEDALREAALAPMRDWCARRRGSPGALGAATSELLAAALSIEANASLGADAAGDVYCAWRAASGGERHPHHDRHAAAAAIIPFVLAQRVEALTTEAWGVAWARTHPPSSQSLAAAALYAEAGRSPAAMWRLHHLACGAWFRAAGAALLGQAQSDPAAAYAAGEEACFAALRLLAPAARAAPTHLAHIGRVSLTLADAYRARGRTRSAVSRYISGLGAIDAAPPPDGGAAWEAYAGSVNLASTLLGAPEAPPWGLAHVARSPAVARRLRAQVGLAAFAATLLPSAGVWGVDADGPHAAVRGSLAVTLRALDEGQGGDAARSIAAAGLQELCRLESAFHDTPGWFPMVARHLQQRLDGGHTPGPGAQRPPPLLELPQHVDTAASVHNGPRGWAGWLGGAVPPLRGSHHPARLRSLRTPAALLPPLRVAYVSGDFRRHAVGYSLHGVLAAHSYRPASGSGRGRVAAACYHTAGFDAAVEGASAAVVGTAPAARPGALNTSAPFNIADGDSWGRHRDLRSWWDARVRPALEGSIAQGAPPATLAGRVDAQLAHPFYALHTPRLVEACSSFYAPLLWRQGAPWDAGELARHIAGTLPGAPTHGAGAHVAVDASGPTQSGAGALLFAHASPPPAPLRVHYMSGPLSVLHPQHAQYMLLDAAVLPPDLAWATVPRCLPAALGLARVGGTPLGGCGGGGAPATHAAPTATLPTLSESPVYLPPTFLASTYPSLQRSPPRGAPRGRRGAGAPSPPPPPRRRALAFFMPPAKLDPEMLSAWAGALAAAGGGGGGGARHRAAPPPPPRVLSLLTRGGGGPADGVCARLAAEGAARGLHPSRVACRRPAPKEAYMRWLAGAELFLDGRLYGAHTTAADALRQGVPVLSVQGDRFASRVTGSLLAALDGERRAGREGARERERSVAPVTLAPHLQTHSLKGYQAALARLLQPARAPRARGLLCALTQELAAAPPRVGAASRAAFDYAAVAGRVERALRALWEVRAGAGGRVAGGVVVAPDDARLDEGRAGPGGGRPGGRPTRASGE